MFRSDQRLVLGDGSQQPVTGGRATCSTAESKLAVVKFDMCSSYMTDNVTAALPCRAGSRFLTGK